MDRYNILLSKIYKYIEKQTEGLRETAISVSEHSRLPAIQAEYRAFWELNRNIKEFEKEIKNMEKTDNDE